MAKVYFKANDGAYYSEHQMGDAFHIAAGRHVNEDSLCCQPYSHAHKCGVREALNALEEMFSRREI